MQHAFSKTDARSTLAQDYQITRVVGASLPKVDTLEKITSSGRYVANYDRPGLLYGKVLRSDRPHARITSIDTSKAEALPGVKAVITYRDAPPVRYSPMFALESYSERLIRDKLILENHVRYVGDEVAAVAATSEQIASRALDLIEVRYHELPAVFNVEEAIKDGTTPIHENNKDNIARRTRHGHGDVEKGLKESDFVFEHRFRTSRIHPCPLERHVCITELDANANLVVRSSTQGIYGLRERLAMALGMPISKIRVVKPPYIGGGFGAKLELWLEGICALLTLKCKLPVKMELSREEEFLANPRMPCVINLKTGVNKNGLLRARYANVLFDTGAYAAHGAVIHGVFSGTFLSMYKCPDILCESFVVYTNNPISGSIRGSTGTQAIYAVEQQMDIIARELKLDPIDFRIKNAWKVGDINLEKPGAGVIKSYAFEDCLKQGAERFGWNHPRRFEDVKQPNLRVGVGVACEPLGISGTQGGDFKPGQALMAVCSALVRPNEDGTVSLSVSTVDQGSGQNTVLSQIVAEVLGVSLDNVVLTDVDTETAPVDGPTHASRTTFVVGNSVKSAAEDARTQLLEYAAKLFKFEVDDLELENGFVQLRTDPTQRKSLAEVVRIAHYSDPGAVILGKTTLPPNLQNATPCAVQFVEVAVDTDTGAVEVLRVLSVHDVGRAINPKGVEGQIHGGIRLGLGYALTEEIIIDQVSGTPLNTDLLGYKMFTAGDMPKIECLLVEKPDPSGPFGAKGVGESPAMPMAAAVANAVYDAVGIRIMDLPITPEKILLALGKIK